ncbi:hypothetical protein [Arthrobacter sp. AL12]|uniref:hypothetical protein n=1 Tax=Arthrobacter sp. AL12 TaxID=3042241 RepID=UPI00249C9D20|nr:hypothetical protein [Arthrobacter sp. AL12]MDI3213893.1 hypothetical protein [Arthrobacter sp. AL12]
MGEQGLADVAARLYALPFDDFVAARTAAAKDAAAAKEQGTLAAEVRSLPKPSVAAWAVNMLAARRPGILRELAGLGTAMRAAQSSLDAAELRRLGHVRRQLLGSAVKAAREVAEQQGRKISGAIAAEVEATLRAATADAGAAAAMQSGRLLRGLSADGVDVVDLSGAVALPGLVIAAEAEPVRPGSAGKAARTGTVAGSGTAAEKAAEQPRLRAVRQEPRPSTPSVLERARTLLKDAEDAAAAAAQESRQQEEELAGSMALATELADAVRTLREQLAEREQELKAARKRRELAAARAQQAARAAAKARRTEDLARERVLRLGDTPR